MFLLVPAYPGCPGQAAVKWLLLLLYRFVMHYYVVIGVSFRVYVKGVLHFTLCSPIIWQWMTLESGWGQCIRLLCCHRFDDGEGTWPAKNLHPTLFVSRVSVLWNNRRRGILAVEALL